MARTITTLWKGLRSSHTKTKNLVINLNFGDSGKSEALKNYADNSTTDTGGLRVQGGNEKTIKATEQIGRVAVMDEPEKLRGI